MIKLERSKGFSLIELMIALAITAILASIAMTSYVWFKMRARTSEAMYNIGAIRTCEVAYYGENDAYYQCGITPRITNDLDEDKVTWEQLAYAQFEIIGFAPERKVYFAYEVTPSAGDSADAGGAMPSFIAKAYGDLDDDGNLQTLQTDSEAVNYPEIEKTGDI